MNRETGKLSAKHVRLICKIDDSVGRMSAEFFGEFVSFVRVFTWVGVCSTVCVRIGGQVQLESRL